VDFSGGPIEGALVSDGTHVTTTDESGHFALGAMPGSVAIRAAAEGYTRGSRHLHAPAKRLEFVLYPESVIIGTVVDAHTGTPVAGASVGPMGREGGMAPGARSQSDAQGRFELRGLEPGRIRVAVADEQWTGLATTSTELAFASVHEGVVIPVEASANLAVEIDDGGAPCDAPRLDLYSARDRTWVTVHEQAEASGLRPGAYRLKIHCFDRELDPREIELEPGGNELAVSMPERTELHVQVLDGQGRPARDVDVVLRSGELHEFGRTNERGERAFRLPREGAWTVALRDEPESTITATLSLGGRESVALRSSRSATLSGSVRVHGEPVGGSLRVTVDGRPLSPDQQGHFVSTPLADGPHQLVANLGDVVLEPIAPTETRFEIDATDLQKEFDFRIPTGRITGCVLDPSGEPAADAVVELLRAGFRPIHFRGHRPVLTDAEGCFEIDRVPADMKYTLRARVRDAAEAVVEGVAAGDEVEMYLPIDGATLHVSALGVPADEGVELRLVHESGTVLREWMLGSHELDVGGLGPGRWTVHALGRTLAGRAEVQVEAGGASSTAIRLRPRVEIRGCVVDEAGLPVAHARVFASVPGHLGVGTPAHISTDDEGRFVHPGVPLGEIDFTCGRGMWTVEVAEDTAPLELVIRE
jgi:protocatechuate 3,4-dioxygenase beta subunit